MADIPHFALPLRFVNGAAVVVEQDTTDEILSCVLAIMLCPIGYRVELPTFGIPDPAFTQMPVNTAELELALDTWEPRSHEVARASTDPVDELMAHVLVRVGVTSED
jgi:hypothetical protein